MFSGEFVLSLEQVSTPLWEGGARNISFIVHKYQGYKELRIISQQGIFQDIRINGNNNDIFIRKNTRIQIIESLEPSNEIIQRKLLSNSNNKFDERVYQGILSVSYDSDYSKIPRLEILIYCAPNQIDSILSIVTSTQNSDYAVGFSLGQLFESPNFEFGDHPDGNNCVWTIPTEKNEWGSDTVDNQPLSLCRFISTPKEVELETPSVKPLNPILEQLGNKINTNIEAIQGLINWVFNVNVFIVVLLVVLIIVT